MTPAEWSYVVFGILLLLAVIFDLGLFSKKGKAVSIKQALFQTVFWVLLGMGYAVFVMYEDSSHQALEYLSAYFMEWGLSLDNIFVFILIFSFFNIPDTHTNRLLLYGILLAVFLRVIFITVGIALIAKFHWILYLFGIILLITGVKMFFSDTEAKFDPDSNFIYRILRKFFRLTKTETDGRMTIKRMGKRLYSKYFVVFVLLAGTDILFALDSIPAVFAITQDKMVVYTSNILAVLGLRSLFFLLKGVVSRFEYLHSGIAFVLVFIGIKMLITFFGIDIHIVISLAVILLCIGGSIVFSLFKNKQNKQIDNSH